LLLWARQAGDIDPLLQQRRVNAGSATLSAYVGGWTQDLLSARIQLLNLAINSDI